MISEVREKKEIKKDVSGRIAIGLKVYEDLYLKIVEDAKKQDRSLSNYILQIVKKHYNID
jgi:predicted HicB family RNase H-like nuclease